MTIRAADATFEMHSFTWANGVFELRGEWHDADELGRVRLLVDVGGRRKSLGAQGGREAEDGPRWGARFICMTEPDVDGYAAVQVAGREIELPSPALDDTPPPPPAPVEASEEPEVRGAEALLQELRAERQVLERLRADLQKERRAAEEAHARLGQAPRPARRALPQRPGPAREAEDVDYTPAFWVAGVIAFLFLLVLLWIF